VQVVKGLGFRAAKYSCALKRPPSGITWVQA